MTTNPAPEPASQPDRRKGVRGSRLRRMLGIAMTSAVTSAVMAVGGAAAVPAATAQAAGVQSNQLTHVATLADAATTTTTSTVTLSDAPRFTGMRLRVTPDGKVEDA